MIPLILALLSGGDGLAEQKRALLEAVANTNDTKAAEAVAKISGHDSREAVEVLVSALAAVAKFTGSLEPERARLFQTMEANAYDPETKKWRGSADRFKEAKARHDDLAAKLARLAAISGAAARGLAKMRSDAAVAEMLARLRSEPSPAIRASIAAGLAGAPAAAELAAQLKKEKDPGVRVALLDAIRAPEAVEAITAALRDEFWQVRIAAAQALGALRIRETAAAIIEALSDSDGRVRSEMNAALMAITGVNKHGDPAAWKSWWERNGEAFLAGTYKPEPAERAQGPGGTTFYGLPVNSRHVVFVIDRSGSMAGPAKWKPEDVASGDAPGIPKPKGDRKIDIAKYELKKVLAMLPEGTEFNIVFFGTMPETFSDRMVVLTKDARRRANEYVDSIEIGGSTNVSGALDKGMGGLVEKLGKSGVDTVYLLTDGMPTSGITDPKELLEHVAGANRLRKIAIHTIAIEPSNDSERLMKQLARENGGSYAKR